MTKNATRAKAKPKTRVPARKRKRGLPIGWIVAGVVTAAALVAVIATSGGDGTGATATGDRVDVAGEALPPIPRSGSDPAVGRAAPQVRGSGFDGAPVALTRDGRPTMIMFLAHWCSHCQKEVPLVQSWIDREGAPPGIDLMSVSTSVDATRGNYPPHAWLEREGWSVPVLADDDASTAGRAFGVTSYPAFVFLDGQGRVVARTTGELPIERIESLIAAATA